MIKINLIVLFLILDLNLSLVYSKLDDFSDYNSNYLPTAVSSIHFNSNSNFNSKFNFNNSKFLGLYFWNSTETLDLFDCIIKSNYKTKNK